MAARVEAAWLVARLLPWYREHARDLPWRREPTAYRVLLSEVMLQQTRVETVIPYFERFVERWPDLAALAGAPDDEVLAAWAGLGYYARARRLLVTARAATLLGGLPDTAEELLGLPGIGPYTAGAVASIAFGRPTPLVDGNVERVISRVDRREEDPRREGRAALWERVGELHEASDPPDPGALNQGLMELGATVCLPRAPRCDRCPWSEGCLAGPDAAALPRKEAKAAPRTVRLVAVVARDAEGRVLLARRPAEGLLGGLWEPPCAQVGPDGTVDLAMDGLGAGTWVAAGRVVHLLTHRRLEVEVVRAEGLRDLPRDWCDYVDQRWTDGTDPVGMSELARKILAAADGSAPRSRRRRG